MTDMESKNPAFDLHKEENDILIEKQLLYE